MEIEVDFEVYKALTLLRRDEADSCNDVIRRLLMLAESVEQAPDIVDGIRSFSGGGALAKMFLGNEADQNGAWIGKVFFPNGTQFRATYKGQTFRASVERERWVDQDGTVRRSPSEAAGAISGTNVNGWRFWYALRPQDQDWRRLDEFRK